jgi:hypothetical protein
VKVLFQENPLAVWTGVTASRNSCPLLLMLPALIDFDVKPVVAVIGALKIWFSVFLS